MLFGLLQIFDMNDQGIEAWPPFGREMIIAIRNQILDRILGIENTDWIKTEQETYDKKNA